MPRGGAKQVSWMREFPLTDLFLPRGAGRDAKRGTPEKPA